MKILHFITAFYPPTNGGLEYRTQRIAQAFSDNGYKVIVHVLSNEHGTSFYKNEFSNIEIVLPTYKNKLLEEPFLNCSSNDNVINSEKWRISYLCLKNEIINQVNKNPNATHILISNFVTWVGYTTTLVADVLKLSHVVSVVGTDFSRGFHNPFERSIFEFVINKATSIITLNNEQKKEILDYQSRVPIKTIHGSIISNLVNRRWNNPFKDTVTIYSDGGFSYKKGTQILLSSFAKLLEEKFPVKLIICGENLRDQENYWKLLKKNYLKKYNKGITFLGYISQDEITEIALKSHIYCLPTLGEGCSNSRMAALNIGIPIVSTVCGEIADVAKNISHVRLCLPGDVEGFYLTLRQLVIDFIEHKLEVDTNSVEKWNLHFNKTREINEWLQVINSV